MKLINFDKHFQDALTQWIQDNAAKFKNADAMEEAAPAFYAEWLDTPADFLDGRTPSTYFSAETDAAELTGLLEEYTGTNVPVPDPLLTRLRTLGDEEALLTLAGRDDASTEARLHAMAILRELGSVKPMVEYIRWQVIRDVDGELVESALESLREMGEPAIKPVKIAFRAADDEAKEALLDVLCETKGDDDVVQFAIRRFKECKDKRALYAGYLGKLDDDRALEPLLDAAEASDISYIDFIEIRNAIERLGGEAPYRDFEDDPTYIAVQQLQVR